MTLSFTNDIGILASATTISGAMDEADKMQTTGSDNAYEAAMWRSISLTHVEYPKGLCLGHTYVFTLRATSVKLQIRNIVFKILDDFLSQYCDYLPFKHVTYNHDKR